jgi:hypothetical protein
VVMNTQNTANYVLVDLDAEGQSDCWAIRGQPQLGFRRFISTTASMSSLSGPFGPGLCRHFGENSNRYFRFLSALWKYSKVVGLRTMAERKRRDGRTKNAHRPAMMRSAARSLGARFRPRFKISS